MPSPNLERDAGPATPSPPPSAADAWHGACEIRTGLWTARRWPAPTPHHREMRQQGPREGPDCGGGQRGRLGRLGGKPDEAEHSEGVGGTFGGLTLRGTPPPKSYGIAPAQIVTPSPAAGWPVIPPPGPFGDLSAGALWRGSDTGPFVGGQKRGEERGGRHVWTKRAQVQTVTLFPHGPETIATPDGGRGGRGGDAPFQCAQTGNGLGGSETSLREAFGRLIATGPGRGGWHKASVSDCVPVAAPIGLSPLLILTLRGSDVFWWCQQQPGGGGGVAQGPGGGGGGGTCELWNGRIWCGQNLAPILKHH